MKIVSFFIVIFLLIINNIKAHEFYTFLGKSESYLINNLGAAHNIKTVNSMKVYQYFYGSDENTVYSIKSNNVTMAIKSYKCYSLASAKTKSGALILYYLSLGFTKQGHQSGMTILKKGNRVLSIGYLDNNNGTYSAMATAF